MNDNEYKIRRLGVLAVLGGLLLIIVASLIGLALLQPPGPPEPCRDTFIVPCRGCEEECPHHDHFMEVMEGRDRVLCRCDTPIADPLPGDEPAP